MPVNAHVLAGSLGGLADRDLTFDLARALQRAVNAATLLFGVDGAGADQGTS
jgi:hypothetical protein